MPIELDAIGAYIQDQRDDLMTRTTDGRSVHLHDVVDAGIYCTVSIFQRDGQLVWKDTDGVFTVNN